MSVENDLKSIVGVQQYINRRVQANNQTGRVWSQQKLDQTTKKFEKIEVRRNPQTHQTKALKALVKIENHIVNMAIVTGSPVSFLNCTTTKQILERSSNSKFIPAEKPNLTAQFVDYNKRPILILRALQADLRSTGWELRKAPLLVTERRTRCILGLDLQGRMGIHTTQKSALSKRSRFDVLLCEQSEG